ncbi:MAG: F0F1 ATP synthase subunit alpha, partial [Candidatus Magasanikbacteria bacterium CG_4_10_14_0_2_um_filter_33_14]
MSTNQVIEELKKHISAFEKTVEVEEVGTVIEVGDGIARMNGLTSCQSQEMLEFPGGIMGV